MNLDQLLSLLRTILKVVGGILVAHGYISDGGWEQVAGLILTLAPIGWDLYVHSTSGKLAAVEAMDDVAKVITTPGATGAVAAAAADDSRPKVTTG
jgi:hypothetical protein